MMMNKNARVSSSSATAGATTTNHHNLRRSSYVMMLWFCVLLLWSTTTTLATTKTKTRTASKNHTNKKNESSSSVSSSSPFKIILDGGSTGSRLHIFEFVEDHNEDDESSTTTNTTQRINNNSNNATTANKSIKQQCVRRGSVRADIPLSAFGRLESNKDEPIVPSVVAEHLVPLFEYAASIIPQAHHSTTKVYYQATAGIRLLTETEQQTIYDALYEGLLQHPSFVFSAMERKDIATLSGEMEAFYGAVAANFLQGVIDTELRLLPAGNKKEKELKQFVDNNNDDEDDDHPVVGALDMGGSSTQIVYIHDSKELPIDATGTCLNTQQQQVVDDVDDGDITSNNTCLAPESPQIRDEHFFSTSYLSYGVDQFRERLWNTLVAERTAEEEDYPESCVAKIIPNPCANPGFEVEWQGYTLLGTGNTVECIRYTQRLIPHPEEPVHSPPAAGRVGGIDHPPVRGKFLAMSLYFFSLDSLRVFSHPKEDAHIALNRSWPNPSIQELEDALDGLCSRDWHTDMALQEGVHAFTRAEVLPHRCLETVYMVTLLKDGFGFQPNSRDITFTFLVDGNEVEWTLGMALAMNAEERYYQRVDKDGGLNMKPIDKQFAVQQGVLNPLLFGVTLPPTHCC